MPGLQASTPAAEMAHACMLVRHRGVRQVAEAPNDAAYDVMARALASEARGAATDRVLLPEEAAERERARLEALERERCVGHGWGPACMGVRASCSYGGEGGLCSVPVCQVW